MGSQPMVILLALGVFFFAFPHPGARAGADVRSYKGRPERSAVSVETPTQRSPLLEPLAPYLRKLRARARFSYAQPQEDSLATATQLGPIPVMAGASDGVVSMDGTFDGFQDITTCFGSGIFAGPNCSDVSIGGRFDTIVTKSGSPGELTGQWQNRFDNMIPEDLGPIPVTQSGSSLEGSGFAGIEPSMVAGICDELFPLPCSLSCLSPGQCTLIISDGAGGELICAIQCIPANPNCSEFWRLTGSVSLTEVDFELESDPLTGTANCSGWLGGRPLSGSLTLRSTITLTANAPRPCGDGLLESGEQCDDGNNLSGDGCDEDCELEDSDDDGIPDDGDGSGVVGDHPCTGGVTSDCDDNCAHLANPGQADQDGDGIGSACECGDFNADGFVDTVDARLIQRCSVGEFECAALCDVTGEGDCNTIDARLVQRLAVGELTKDDLTCAERP